MVRLSLLLAALALTQLAEAAPSRLPEFFSCGSDGGGNTISLQVGGARYGDAISFDLDDGKEATALFFANEKGRTKYNAELRGWLQYGACVRGTGNTLVTCGARDKDWGFVDFSYSYSEELAKDVSQQVRINRQLSIQDISIVVTKVGRQAHLTMTAILDDRVVAPRTLKMEKDLGTLDHDWFMCQFK